MPRNFEGHRTTDYKNRWLYFTVHEDEDEGGFYAEIFDRAGKDVATVPTTSSYSTKAEAKKYAIDFIQKREAKGREISPEL